MPIENKVPGKDVLPSDLTDKFPLVAKKNADHRSHLSRVNRIEGQVRGVKNMIEEGKYCVDILTQIKAMRNALKGATNILEGRARS